MTPLTIISGVGLIAALGVIAFILLRKVPQLRLVDPMTAPDRRDQALKKDLMRQRLERESAEHLATLSAAAQKPWEMVRDAFRRAAGRLVALERKYVENQRFGGVASAEVVAALMGDAEKLEREGEYEQAEKKLVEAITLSPKHVPAYLALGALYQDMKQPAEAKESYAFAAKLNPRDIAALSALGQMAEDEEDHEQAFTWYGKARAVQPNNPKLLDAFIRTAIAAEKNDVAQEALQVLRDVNPENGKIEEYARELGVETFETKKRPVRAAKTKKETK